MAAKEEGEASRGKRQAKQNRAVAYLIVNFSQGRMYAQVLGKLHTDVNTEASNTTGLRSRPTKKGDVILKLSNKSDKAAFTYQVP